jgi:hypothetical protein
LAALLLSLSIQKLCSPDIWWELRTGQWILQHSRLPTQDVLSYTAAGHEWIEMHWLFCLGAYLLWRLGGPALLILGQSVLLASAYLVIVWPLRRAAATLLGLVIVGLGIFSASPRFHVRPEGVTFLGLAVFLTVLGRYARDHSTKFLWSLPVIQVLWVNSHALSVLGPVVLGLFACGELLRGFFSHTSSEARPARRWSTGAQLALVAVVVTAACWVNPYGHRGAMFPLEQYQELRKSSVTGLYVEEFLSPFGDVHWSPDAYTTLALTLITAWTCLMTRGSLQLIILLVWLPFVYLAAMAVRNFALLSLVSTWACLSNLDEYLATRQNPAGEAQHGTTGRWIFALSTLALSWFIVTDRYYVGVGLPWRFGLGVIQRRTPSKALEFLSRAKPRPQLFHSMSDGSYLTWAGAGQIPVFLDGRLEVYGQEFLGTFVDLLLNPRKWETFADAEGIDTAVLQTEYVGSLIGILNSSKHWVLVHIDSQDLVYVRDIPEHADLIRRYRIDPRQPWDTRGLDEQDTPSGWRRYVGSVEEPWYDFGMARNLLLVGGVANASWFVDRGLARSPNHQGLLELKGAINRIQARQKPISNR